MSSQHATTDDEGSGWPFYRVWRNGDETVRVFLKFPDISRSVLGAIMTERLGYIQKVVYKMGTEYAQAWTQTKSCSRRSRISWIQWIRSWRGDCDIWVCHYSPERKRQSSPWRHTTSTSLKKFKTTQLICRIIATIFWTERECCWWNLRIEVKQSILRLAQEIAEKRKKKSPTCSVASFTTTRSFSQKPLIPKLTSPSYSPDFATSDNQLFTKFEEVGREFFDFGTQKHNWFERRLCRKIIICLWYML